MKIEVGYGSGRSGSSYAIGREAAEKALATIHHHPVSAVIVYSSVRFDLKEVLSGIQSMTGDAPVLGTTTAGEICNELLSESVVVAALASSYLKVKCGVGRGVSHDWRGALDQTLNSASIKPFFDGSVSAWQDMTRQGKTVFAMFFSPGNTRQAGSRSYEILETLKQKSLGRLPIFGGSSADDWRLEKNYVLLGREALPDSLLLAIFETELQFGIAMDDGFRPTSVKTRVTRVEGHEILELDEQPAAAAYAELVDVPSSDLDGKHLTLTTGHTLGSSDPMGQFSINVASYITPQGGINFTQPVSESTILTLMEADPDGMRTAGREALRKAMLRGGIREPAIALTSYCALRQRMAGRHSPGEISLMREMIEGAPLAGFCSFGEQGVADDGTCRHNNAVVSVLVIGNDLAQTARVAIENAKLHGELARYAKQVEDLAEEVKHQSKAQQRRLEEQLIQSQKLEAIGELSGGVAHDFNNILSAIVGYTDLTLMRLRPDDPLRGNLEQILQASERATTLTQSLLLFSRKRVVNLQPGSLNEIVTRFRKFLLRLIREDIEITIKCSEEELIILADSAQIEQMLMNLVTNARDAMPEGGQISIRTHLTRMDEAFVEAHGYGKIEQYALLLVSDTGEGMDAKTKEKIFDPFFTTKEQGKGTGLGLSMVYGIVKQHDGFIDVYSEPAKGTTFKIYLPLHTLDRRGAAEEQKEAKNLIVKGGSETILVAEDDPALRKLASTMLSTHGYRVIEATDGEDAMLKFSENRESIRLVILDGIMPKKNGKEVYERIRSLSPYIKAIFVSGYAEDILSKEGLLEPEINFLLKPVSPSCLLKKVRELLDSCRLYSSF